MRDVTDNVTGELEVMVKRGRGRPRKEGALTNAQRQAAYRARKANIRNSRDVTLSVSQASTLVDTYDECRLEVEDLRAELAEAHETIDEMTAQAGVMRYQVESLQGDLKREVQRSTRKDFELGKVREEYAQLEKAAMAVKSVTPAGNVNSQQFHALLSLLDEACKVRRSESVARIVKAPAWPELVAGELALSKRLREDLERAVMGQTSAEILAGWEKDETVTRKAVTKK